MGIFSRFWNLLRGKANAALDKFDNPEEQLPLFIEKMNGQVAKLQRSVAAALADEKKIRLQLEGLVDQAKGWESKAELALKEGDEELAREALARKGDCESQALVLAKTWETQKHATQELRQSLMQAKGQVEEARRKANLMLAQYRSAETKQNLAKTLSNSATGESPMKYLDKLNDKILQIEAETEAQLELSDGSGRGDVDARFAQLERRSQSDAALNELKAKLAGKQAIGPGNSQGLLASGDARAKAKIK